MSDAQKDPPEWPAVVDSEPSGIVGRYFHVDGDAVARWYPNKQGQVVDKIDNDAYVVVYFDFVMGDPSYQAIVKLDDMLEWRFYSDSVWMNCAYSKHRLTRDERKVRKL